MEPLANKLELGSGQGRRLPSAEFLFQELVRPAEWTFIYRQGLMGGVVIELHLVHVRPRWTGPVSAVYPTTRRA